MLIVGGNPFKPSGPREPPSGELRHKQVRRVDLHPVKAIGAGQFGQVYLAKQIVPEKDAEEVIDGVGVMRRAVKMLRGGASKDDKLEFVKEATTMLAFNHENLVQVSY